MDNRYIYAMGGYIEQNRAPHSQCFVYDVETNEWKKIANLTSPRGAIALSCLNGVVHAVGGRDVRSVDTHEVYDPKTNRWTTRAPLPGMRDHIGNVVLDGRMHATVRNSSCRIHGGAIVAGVEAALAKKKTPASPPKQIVIDGPIVTPANAPGLLWMQEHFLI